MVTARRLVAGDTIAVLEGSARSILMAERTMLNFIGRLSGVATLTAQFAKAIAHIDAKIVCTRKTTPGHRALEKRAVRCGGGTSHRYGLDDAILIKDNHIAACDGSIETALKRAKAYAGHLRMIEVEVDTLEQLERALPHGPDAILLDNMDNEGTAPRRRDDRWRLHERSLWRRDVRDSRGHCRDGR